ncbi:hypothetical protein ABB55_20325 [Prosthecomicrobium hirschii]|uniref:Thioesterase domain-containing protein n=1 Tax=Prosthecodimorpha hirschii TaxID=665126 RepID=A0A0P6WHQ6_9HYPH|nr:PaaI family thioesterase [Prosthecomicrobium hirschii]KPL54269.1 hypothetical protein ABB55_20325 [Prosthecomicrobium hirschii]
MAGLETRDPNWIQKTLQTFNSAAYIRDLGCRLIDIEPGRVVTELDLAGRHLQQNGYVHAGVQAAIADHTAGTACITLTTPSQIILSIELKLSLMVAARGEKLICRGEVLKAGSRVSFAEAKVYAVESGRERLVSHATVSLAVVEKQPG